MIQITVDNLPELLKDFKGFENEARKAVKKGVDRTALAVESDAKRRLHGELGSSKHWITGRLAASVHAKLQKGQSFQYTAPVTRESFNGTLVIEPDPNEAFAGTNVEYAGKIEFLYDSFLGWAAVNQAKKFKDRITEELNKIRK